MITTHLKENLLLPRPREDYPLKQFNKNFQWHRLIQEEIPWEFQRKDGKIQKIQLRSSVMLRVQAIANGFNIPETVSCIIRQHYSFSFFLWLFFSLWKWTLVYLLSGAHKSPLNGRSVPFLSMSPFSHRSLAFPLSGPTHTFLKTNILVLKAKKTLLSILVWLPTHCC